MLYHIFCLFRVFRPTQEFFTHMETSTLPMKGCKFWPIHSTHGHGALHDGSLACHTYCDTWHPFIMVISEDPWHSHLLPSVWQWSCHYLFLQLRSVSAGIRTPNLPLAGQSSKPLCHHRGFYHIWKSNKQQIMLIMWRLNKSMCICNILVVCL